MLYYQYIAWYIGVINLIKAAVVIQCDITCRRCSGFACSKTFFQREDYFSDYPEDTMFFPMTCGGCCGKGLSAKLSHFLHISKKKLNILPEEVVVHLASCITTENRHFERCPHFDYLVSIIRKNRYTNIVEGTYLSQNSERKRQAGIYKIYPPLEK